MGRLHKDAVLRFRYTDSHERRPGRRREFDGRFDPPRPGAYGLHDPVVYVLSRGANPQMNQNSPGICRGCSA